MFITEFDVVTSGDLTISDVVICRYIAATEDLQMIANQQATPGKGVLSKPIPPGRSVRCITPVGMAPIQLPVLPEIWFERFHIYGSH